MDLRFGPLSLVVRDLGSMMHFYVEEFGFKMKQPTDQFVELYSSEESQEPLIVLRHDVGAETQPVEAAGLYHYALLQPSRENLAAAYLSLGNAGVVFDGYADHRVSEALYLNDPEGNGIEIYADRPREKWKFDDDGQVQMATEPLDIDSLLTEVSGIPQGNLRAAGTGLRIGHVHLKVSNLARSIAFYRQLLGMDLMRYYESAAFLSLAGYHHHLGMNTWESLGGPSRKKEWTGLEYFTVKVPAQDFDTILAKLSNSSIPYTQDSGRLFVADPDGIEVLIRRSD